MVGVIRYIFLASLKGFEPPTHGLEGRCSIQLSYRLIFFIRLGTTNCAPSLILERVMGIGPTRPAWKAGILPLNYTRTMLENNNIGKITCQLIKQLL